MSSRRGAEGARVGTTLPLRHGPGYVELLSSPQVVMIRFVSTSAVCAASIVWLGACASSPREVRGESNMSSPSVSAVESAAGWRSLFDGRTLAGWRGYRSQSLPGGWVAKDGMLVREGSGGDIVTDESFGNFELTLEWKISPGGNSGIMYRVTESAEHPYESGPEMQVLDDARHRDGQSPLTSAGALYGLYPAPTGAVKPVGEWNAVRIVVNGNH